jgi:hypothetical protein
LVIVVSFKAHHFIVNSALAALEAAPNNGCSQLPKKLEDQDLDVAFFRFLSYLSLIGGACSIA